MKITKSIVDGERLYDLVLSRRDFDDICSGCPDGGFIFGRHTDVCFHIFDGNEFSDAWRPMDDGYFLNVGVPAPVPSPSATSGEWDKSALEFYDSLERAINNSGRIPIEAEITQIPEERKTISLGYAVMRVEPAQESEQRLEE